MKRIDPTSSRAAIDSFRTGYPGTFTPLPVAYPDDVATFDLANIARHQYSWLLGSSLLACPLMGADFDSAETRDVYLPAGKWLDFETGQRYQGPTTLKDHSLPMDKMPLFVGERASWYLRTTKGNFGWNCFQP